MSDTPYSPKSPLRSKRRGKTRTLAATVSAITKPIFGKRGFADGAIVRDWPIIVGEKMAAVTIPEHITYPRQDRGNGALSLRIASGSIALELQHLEPVLVDRINGYFGYRAVERIKLIQGPMPAPPPPPPEPEPELDATAEQALANRLTIVEDPEIRDALEALGRSVAARQTTAK